MSCSIADCENPADGHGLCSAHRKRAKKGGNLAAPLKPAPTSRPPLEVLQDAALRYADAESDEDFRSATDVLRKSAKTYGRKEQHHRISEGLWRRKAAGLPVGRRPKLTRADAEAAVATEGGVRAGARALGVSLGAMRRALRRPAAGGSER